MGSIPSIGSKPEKVFSKFVLVQCKESKRGERELPCGNDRPTMRSTTQQWAKRNEKKGEYQSGQMGQTVNLLVYTFGGSNPSSPTKARTETDRAFTLKIFAYANAEFSCKPSALETCLHCRGAAEKPAKFSKKILRK